MTMTPMVRKFLLVAHRDWFVSFCLKERKPAIYGWKVKSTNCMLRSGSRELNIRRVGEKNNSFIAVKLSNIELYYHFNSRFFKGIIQFFTIVHMSSGITPVHLNNLILHYKFIWYVVHFVRNLQVLLPEDRKRVYNIGCTDILHLQFVHSPQNEIAC